MTTTSPARVVWERRPVLAVVGALDAVAAWAGAAGLVTGFLTLGRTVERRLPFGSPVLGGLALAAIVAVPSTALAWFAWRGDRRTGPVAVLSGGLLIGWIVGQVLVIRELSWFHPTYLVIGAGLVGAGRRPSRRTEEAMR
ncbi:MAG: hypothetical protein ACXV8T_00625 [Acidimicrobiia bacterium]